MPREYRENSTRMTHIKKSVGYHRKDKTAEVRLARRLFQQRTKQGAYATAAFLMSCGVVTPFLKGFPLDTYWVPVGRNLLLLPMFLLVPFVIFVGRVFNAWLFVREMEKIDE